MIAIGHLGNADYIAGAGLAFTLMNIFVYGVFLGLNGALDTLISHASGAAHQVHANHVLNRARTINTILFVPIGILLAFNGEILMWMGVDPKAAAHSSWFLQLQIPGLFCLVHFNTSV